MELNSNFILNQLKLKIMLRKTLLLIITIITVSQTIAQKSNKCNYTIKSYSWSFDGGDIGKHTNVTIHDAASQAIVNNGNKLALKGGDVICMDASVPYQFLRFKNIVGDPGNPVVITNVGGQVEIKSTTASYGWKFQKSSNFKIRLRVSSPEVPVTSKIAKPFE